MRFVDVIRERFVQHDDIKIALLTIDKFHLENVFKAMGAKIEFDEKKTVVSTKTVITFYTLYYRIKFKTLNFFSYEFFNMMKDMKTKEEISFIYLDNVNTDFYLVVGVRIK